MQSARMLAVIVGALSAIGMVAAVPAGAPSVEAATSTDESGLTGVEWRVISVGPAAPAKEQMVRFEPDGGLAIWTGCATYTGSYSMEGERLEVGQTSRDFGSIEDCTFSEQGSANVFRDTLESAETWLLDEEGRLVIDAPGGWSLTLEPAAPVTGRDDGSDAMDPEAVTGTWQLESIEVALAGETIVPPPDAGITLMLADDGTFDGHAGCSAYEGAYTIVGEDTISLSDVTAATSNDCPSQLADLQQLYLGILPVIDRIRVAEGALVLGAAMLTADLTYQRAP